MRKMSIVGCARASTARGCAAQSDRKFRNRPSFSNCGLVNLLAVHTRFNWNFNRLVEVLGLVKILVFPVDENAL